MGLSTRCFEVRGNSPHPQRLTEKYPDLRLVTVRPSDDDRDTCAAEAVRQAGRTDVKVMGLSLPNINKKYVHEDVVQVGVLWNTTNLGYLTVQAAALAARGTLAAGASSIQAGRLGP